MSREVARAIFKNDVAKFDSLIENGVDINSITDQEGWNFLHRALLAVSNPPSLEMVKHLIDKGVDVNAIDCYGNTPLHYAARLKAPDLIKVLLDAGSHIDPVNFEGVTPLRETLLVKPFNLDAIDIFLSRGANMDHCSQGAATVKEYAEIIGRGADAGVSAIFKKYSELIRGK